MTLINHRKKMKHMFDFLLSFNGWKKYSKYFIEGELEEGEHGMHKEKYYFILSTLVHFVYFTTFLLN